jgi:excisionase family DNA binding protein
MTTLPDKELLRVDEVATYFSVTDRTIRLWIEHGRLEAIKKVGTVRITRESVLDWNFKIKKPEIPLDITAEK